MLYVLLLITILYIHNYADKKKKKKRKARLFARLIEKKIGEVVREGWNPKHHYLLSQPT